jgi:uncharacterized membrane protein
LGEVLTHLISLSLVPTGTDFQLEPLTAKVPEVVLTTVGFIVPLIVNIR